MFAKGIWLKCFSAFAALLIMASIIFAPASAFAMGSAASGLGAPKGIAGWSAAIVLTGSMQSTIPQGSLIVTQPVAPEDLAVGDDITYLSSPTTSVTHRIVEVIPNYGANSGYAFVTKGTDNPKPDDMPVAQENVVGRVVFHSHMLGVVLSFIRSNWPLLVTLVVIAWAFVKVVRRINMANPPSTVKADALLEGHQCSQPQTKGRGSTIRVIGYSMKRKEQVIA